MSKLISMADYIKDNMKIDRKFKNDKERRRFLEENGVKTIKHPKTKNDMVPVEKEMELLAGKRVSTKRTKEEDFGEDKAASKEAFAKGSGTTEVAGKVNTKARVGLYKYYINYYNYILYKIKLN